MSVATQFDIATLSQSIDERWARQVELVHLNKKVLTHANQVIGVAVDLPTIEGLSLAVNNSLKHCVQTANLDFVRELNVSALMLHDMESFFRFPVGAVLDPNGTLARSESEFCFFKKNFCSSKEKNDLLMDIEASLARTGAVRNSIEDALKISDELITNAIYNAPFAKNLVPGVHGISRSAGVVNMTEDNHGEFFLGRRKDTLVLGCRDPYGSLNLPGVLERVLSCYTQGVDKTMNMGPGGAGIGTYMVFEGSTSVFMAVEPGQQTLCAAVLPLRMSQKKKQMIPKNFHFHCGD